MLESQVADLSLPGTEAWDAKWIRAILVEADDHWRTCLRSYLDEQPEMQIIGEYRDAAELPAVLRSNRPDLLLVDVELPDIRLAGGLHSLGIRYLRAIIATATDRRSLQQFARGAVDTLLKPIDITCFEKALMFARWHIQVARMEAMVARLRTCLPGSPAGHFLRRFAVEKEGRLFFVRVEDVDWIQAAGNYIHLHVGSNSHQLRHTMNSLESALDPYQFLRVHRSVIVNLERVQEFQLPPKGNMFVVLQSGKRLPLSRSIREQLRRALCLQQHTWPTV